MKLHHALLAMIAVAACSPAVSPEAASAPARAGTAEGVTVDAPLSNARVTSPLVATGVAPGSWYFEAVFRAQLLSPDGAVIAEAPAQAQSDWMTPGPVQFRAELTFVVTADTPAILLLQEDMPDAEMDDGDHTDDRPTRELRIPVVLTAGE